MLDDESEDPDVIFGDGVSGRPAHVPTFTEAEWFGMHDQRVGGVGLYCSCGWVWGMGNRLGCERAFDNHLVSVMGIAKFHS